MQSVLLCAQFCVLLCVVCKVVPGTLYSAMCSALCSVMCSALCPALFSSLLCTLLFSVLFSALCFSLSSVPSYVPYLLSRQHYPLSRSPSSSRSPTLSPTPILHALLSALPCGWPRPTSCPVFDALPNSPTEPRSKIALSLAQPQLMFLCSHNPAQMLKI
jgi:hypothetical protein